MSSGPDLFGNFPTFQAEDGDAAAAELGKERERVYCCALDRCLEAGARRDDVDVLAAGLGVADVFRTGYR